MNPIDDLHNYIYGIFYYNPEDRRTIVPRRIGFWGSGYTMNFAKPVSRLVLILLLILIGLLIYAIAKSATTDTMSTVTASVKHLDY